MAIKKSVKSRPKRGSGTSVHETVTATLIEMMEAGTPPWRTRWSSRPRGGGRPRKPILVPERRLPLPLSVSTRKPYQGVNTLFLWAAAIKKLYPSPYWGTYRAWSQLGCQVKAGEKATRIIRWVEKTEVDPRTGKEEDVSFPVVHPVFNVAQVDGPEEVLGELGGNQPPLVMVPLHQAETTPASEPASWAPAEMLVTELNPTIHWLGRQACYNLVTDVISMPDRVRFATQAGLYTVLLHEVAHWTGHPRRLGRDLNGGPVSQAYWFEELVAELTACFVLAKLDLPDRLEELPNSATYLQHYLDLLQQDRRKLFKAASLAQKAADYILSGGTVVPQRRQRVQG